MEYVNIVLLEFGWHFLASSCLLCLAFLLVLYSVNYERCYCIEIEIRHYVKQCYFAFLLVELRRTIMLIQRTIAVRVRYVSARVQFRIEDVTPASIQKMRSCFRSKSRRQNLNHRMIVNVVTDFSFIVRWIRVSDAC